MRRRLGGFAVAALLLLAGCTEVVPGSRASLATAAQRLPEEAVGFRRGRVVDYERERPGQGNGVDYATANRAAVATVSLYDLGRPAIATDPASAEIEAELGRAVQEATAASGARNARRMTERARITLPVDGRAALRCARLEGSFGRSPVRQLVCIGGAGGRYLRVQVTMPDRGAPVADADGFAAAMLRAARGG